MFQNKRNNNKIIFVKMGGWFWNGGEKSLIYEPAIILMEWNRRQTSKQRNETYKWNIGNLLSWARGMFQGARSVGPSLTGREKNGLARSLGMWHIQIEMCALKISLGFLAVPGYHNCCMELMLSSKWCISKFLSKGLFFYYLLNFQTFSNFGRKERTHMRGARQLPRALCVSWSGSLTKDFYFLFNWYHPTAPLHKIEKWGNLSDLFTYIFFRTPFHGDSLYL